VKKLLFLIITVLLTTVSIYCQTLEGYLWQLQNPAAINISSLLKFSKGHFSNSFVDMTTGQMQEAFGVYKYPGKTISITVNNVCYAYNVKWVNSNKVIFSNANEKLIYSKSNTTEDTYFQRYMAWYSGNGNYSGGSYGSGGYYGGGGNYNTPKQEICYTCQGVGSCKICGGLGECSNSYTSGRHTCTACGGDGKCWHCHGSGKQ